ncbi:MAG: DUF1326 domain-containing protein [Amaricoccus sp.]
MGYRLEGDLLEVCNCDVLCPCWIGEDPDRGHCDSALAYRINSGAVGGLDVGGVVMASVVKIPGNVFAGGWRRQLYIDVAASEGQAEVLVEAMTGRLGGPLADLAALVGDDLPPQRAEVVFDLHEGRGRFAIAGISEAVMAPYRGGDGNVTTLNNSAFSTIPGSPAYVAKAERFRLRHAALGLDLELEGKNAIQGSFRFQA